LVERDAFMITWLAQKPARRIVPDESLQPEIREVIRQLEQCGASVNLYLLQSDIDVPTVACIAFGDGRRWPGATVALACHLDLIEAVNKAVLEQGHVGPYIRRLAFEENKPIPPDPDSVRSLIDHALYYVPVQRTRNFEFLDSGDLAPLAISKFSNDKDV